MTKLGIVGILAVRMIFPVSYFGGVPIAKASILSNIESFFSGSSVSADIASSEDSSSQNSQKMPLLEAPSSPIIVGVNAPDFSTNNNALVSQPGAAANSLANSTSTSDQITNYKVKTGDTVTGIAKKFGISVNTVLWSNNLRVDSTLKVGQNLIILPIDGITYTVKAGDTLQALALKYKGDTSEIMAYNNMSSDSLKVGDVIVIPGGEMTASAMPKAKTSVVAQVANAVGIKIANADTSLTTYKGYYMRPITAGVKTQGIHGHNAVDLADACGTPVYASADGTVTVSMNDGKWNGGYGNYVVISHANGAQTLYAHFSQTLVSEGMQVTQGQEIGIMGETGEATGCHVHFEIRNGGIANPF